MIEDTLVKMSSLGISGLLFVMWWWERQDRGRAAADIKHVADLATRTAEVSTQLVDVVRSNTEAVTALREELRSHRTTEIDWLRRLTRQMERVSCE